MLYSNGRLFWQGDKGLFDVSYDTLFGVETSPIQAAGLWIGGVDEVGNLKGAYQLYDEDGKSDFQPGLIQPYYMEERINKDFNKIWRVSWKDIATHQQDYWDNQIIDNPLPSIYSWPGSGNPHSEEYNGFPTPDTPLGLAPFEDKNGDGIYDPDQGDYPSPERRFCYTIPTPDEMLWFAFNDEKVNRSTNTDLIQIEVHCLAYAYHCEEEELLDNTLILDYKVINKAIEPLDSIYVGMFVDFSIGCPEDDYLGTIPEHGAIYAYNSDNTDGPCSQGTSARHNYFASCSMLGRMLVTDHIRNQGIDTVLFQYFESSMPLYLDGEAPSVGQSFPRTSLEFYRYLTGSWRDGSPLHFGQDGFLTEGPAPFPFIYPGHPSRSWEWNEASAGSSPGKRRAIASAGHFRLNPDKINTFTVAFTAKQCYSCYPGGGAYRFNDFFYELDEIQHWKEDCTVSRIPCRRYAPIPPPEPEKKAPEIRVMPNPAHSQTCIFFYNAEAYWYRIYNAKGQLLHEIDHPAQAHILSVERWQHGLYYLQAGIGGEVLTEKFLVY
ncbi:MAG: T9SS type A sorting domain-containing protein [Phaeodactylibacter sp.]|nr:T9SS type A sorting domain-containing protein [Phaeodactylibacter sp.]MCB9047904.1 T9SS type A sorting domain-containing protein [Lewinellaceae bacterium]